MSVILLKIKSRIAVKLTFLHFFQPFAPLSSGRASSSIAIENEASFAQSDLLSGDYTPMSGGKCDRSALPAQADRIL
jgi:hypothetical protein